MFFHKEALRNVALWEGIRAVFLGEEGSGNMEWIEVFISSTQEGLEPVAGMLYQCGLNGLMIHDESDFQGFLDNPNRDWDYVADELVEEKEALQTGLTFFLTDNI